jgi:hypothetical protein
MRRQHAGQRAQNLHRDVGQGHARRDLATHEQGGRDGRIEMRPRSLAEYGDENHEDGPRRQRVARANDGRQEDRGPQELRHQPSFELRKVHLYPSSCARAVRPMSSNFFLSAIRSIDWIGRHVKSSIRRRSIL